LHKIAAYCWHRQRYAANLSWAEFSWREGWEGDHLPDSDLRTRPELALAGRVEAVPCAINRWRAAHLQEAQRALEAVRQAERVAAEAARAFTELRAAQPAGRKRSRNCLADLRDAEAGKQRAEQELGGLREKGEACLLEWDCSWQHALERHGADAATDLDYGIQGSPYAAVLFVEFEGTPRAGLLAYALASERGLFWSSA
jgi:hypothetical protein